MVVPEENSPKNTTTTQAKDSIKNSLKLNYDLPFSEVVNEEKELSERVIQLNSDEEDKLEKKSVHREVEKKEVEIPFESGVETGLEILYTSIKLRGFPIKENNLPLYDEIIENIGLSSSSLRIGNKILSNVNIRILGYKKFKLIEFKTREFKLALSIALCDGNIIKKSEDFFNYEIFSKLKNSRLQAVSEIFRSIFSGEKITFQIKDLQGEIVFENPIQAHKFDTIIESIKKYDDIMKLTKTTKIKNFSEGVLQFYTLHLLHSYLNNNRVLNSWMNFRVNNRFNIKSGDKILFTKVHSLNIRGFNYDLKEIVRVKSPLLEKEVNFEKNLILGYRKVVDIELELVQK